MNEYAQIMRMERERTGDYGNDTGEDCPACLICGKTSDTFYRNRNGDFVGCDNCIRKVYYDELEEEYLSDMSNWIA